MTWGWKIITETSSELLYLYARLASQMDGELEAYLETNLEGKVFSLYFRSSVLLSEAGEKIALKLLKSEMLCLKEKHYPDFICRTLWLQFSQTSFFPKDIIKNTEQLQAGQTLLQKLIL